MKFFRQSECSFDQRYSSHHRSVMETIPERPPPTSGSRTERLRSADDLRSKEQRRRERRERRAARRQQSYGNPPFTIYGSVYGSNMPDLLNSHMPPPPYSTLPHSAGSRSSRAAAGQPPAVTPQAAIAVRSASSRLRLGRPQRLTNGTTDLQR